MKNLLAMLLCISLCTFSMFADSDQLDGVIDIIAVDLSTKLPKDTIACVTNIQSDSESLSQYILTELSTKLVQNGKITIVERKNLDEVQKELEFQYSGEVSDESQQSIAQKLGANVIISGSVEKAGDVYKLRIVALNVETAAYTYSNNYIFENTTEVGRLAGTLFPRLSLGLIGEGNLNNPSGFVPAAGINFNYMFSTSFAIGTRGIVSFDMIDMLTIEPSVLLRWYLHNRNNVPGTGIFLQGDGGCTLVLRKSDMVFSPMGGVTAGYRVCWDWFYAELTARGGYPFMAGVGISAGFRK